MPLFGHKYTIVLLVCNFLLSIRLYTLILDTGQILADYSAMDWQLYTLSECSKKEL